MINKVFFLLLTLSLLGACSSSDDVVPTFPEPGPADDLNEPQSLAVDVPDIPVGSTYYGKHTMTFDEPMSFSLNQDVSARVFDLEYVATDSASLSIDQFYTFTLGGCPTRSSSLKWMEVSSEGDIMEESEIDTFDTLIVASSKRYILRATFENTSGCSQIAVSVTFTKN